MFTCARIFTVMLCVGKVFLTDKDEYEPCKDCKPFGVCKEGNHNQRYSKCQSSGCVEPEDKENAIINGNLYSVGDKIEYKCQTDHTDVFDRPRISTCQNNGVWTPVNIKCVQGQLDLNFFNNSAYLLDKTLRKWDEGKEYCESIGGVLTDVKTKEENDFIMSKVFVRNDDYGAWIGANDRDNTDIWKWLDGSLVIEGFTKWGIGQPNNDQECLLIYNDLMWHDGSCSWYTWSICEIRMKN